MFLWRLGKVHRSSRVSGTLLIVLRAGQVNKQCHVSEHRWEATPFHCARTVRRGVIEVLLTHNFVVKPTVGKLSVGELVWE